MTKCKWCKKPLDFETRWRGGRICDECIKAYEIKNDVAQPDEYSGEKK